MQSDDFKAKIKAEAAKSVAINKVDANVTMKDPVQSWYGFVISQDGTLTVRFPGETKWYWKIVEITCLPVELQKLGKKRLGKSVQAALRTDFVQSEEEDGYYFYTFQGKGKPVGVYGFSFHLTYQSGVGATAQNRTAEFLLDVEVMHEEDTKRQIKLLKADAAVRNVRNGRV